MINLILTTLYLMLPAYFANMIPVLVKKIDFLNYPIDFNKTIKGERILGSHKTIRGLFFGIIIAIVIAYLQFLVKDISFFSQYLILDYNPWILIGFLLGFGALLGDTIKSFFKRRCNVKPGARFFPWDQIDYTLGSLALISLIYIPSWKIILTAIIINLILHIISNHLGYYLKLNKSKW